MDFAQCYKIGISWDSTGPSYLWYKVRKLTSAWHSSSMPQCVTGITNHVTDVDPMSNILGTGLVTTMTVKMPPHHVAVIPITPPSHSLHSNDITTGLIEVIENPLLYIKQPYLYIP